MIFFNLIIIALLVIVMLLYNRLVSFKVKVSEAWSSIDIQLKRRYDMIPNLIETVKGYAAHEKAIFEKVTETRAKSISTTNISERAEAENQLSASLKTLFAVSESYPELKANTNFLNFQTSLSEIEANILTSRNKYNSVVKNANIASQTFPGNIISKAFGFNTYEFFQIAESQKENPNVKF
jgi:LemA protein